MAASDHLSESQFHGTNAELHPGDKVVPTDIGTSERGAGEYSFFTGNKANADYYAHRTAHLHGGEPRVYEIQPHGDVEPDPDDTADWAASFRTPGHLEVKREVPFDSEWKSHIMSWGK
jgi:hypothetical protein